MPQYCHRQFNGKRGVASHQYRCSAKTAAASPVTAAPPPQPPPLQAHVCPKCNFGASKAQGLSQHMRVCCKDLRDASRKPKYSAANYKATPLLEGAQRETIEHVLFECTALSDIRTSSLTTSDRSLRAKEYFAPATATFLRAALAKLKACFPPAPRTPPDPLHEPPHRKYVPMVKAAAKQRVAAQPADSRPHNERAQLNVGARMAPYTTGSAETNPEEDNRAPCEPGEPIDEQPQTDVNETKDENNQYTRDV